VKPDKPAREDFFLHVLHASDAEKPAALPKVELQDVPSRVAAVGKQLKKLRESIRTDRSTKKLHAAIGGKLEELSTQDNA